MPGATTAQQPRPWSETATTSRHTYIHVSFTCIYMYMRARVCIYAYSTYIYTYIHTCIYARSDYRTAAETMVIYCYNLVTRNAQDGDHVPIHVLRKQCSSCLTAINSYSLIEEKFAFWTHPQTTKSDKRKRALSPLVCACVCMLVCIDCESFEGENFAFCTHTREENGRSRRWCVHLCVCLCVSIVSLLMGRISLFARTPG